MSEDLVHWRPLPVAISPKDGHSIFSGSAIIDHHNVTGLAFINSTAKPLIAVFTAHNIATADETQWIAYSNDAPLYQRYSFYANNPIVKSPGVKDFRDPQVFWYKDRFVMLLAAYNRSLIYNSANLIDWTLVSEFGEREGSHKDVWECPSLFPLNVTVNG